MVALGQNWLYSDKVVVFGQKWLNSDKSGCIRSKWFYFKQKWLSSGKTSCIRQSDYIRAKVVLFGQSGCLWVEVVVFR